jgi:hypothetical protein
MRAVARIDERLCPQNTCDFKRVRPLCVAVRSYAETSNSITNAVLYRLSYRGKSGAPDIGCRRTWQGIAWVPRYGRGSWRDWAEARWISSGSSAPDVGGPTAGSGLRPEQLPDAAPTVGRRLRRRFRLGLDMLVVRPGIVGCMDQRDQGRHDRDRSESPPAARTQIPV